MKPGMRPGPTPLPARTDDTELSPAARRFLWIFSVVLVIVAGSAFIMKLIEFSSTALREGTGALASFLIPVLNYLMVAAGFFCLFFWAYFKGYFRDIEEAKYRMLELEAEYDAAAQMRTEVDRG